MIGFTAGIIDLIGRTDGIWYEIDPKGKKLGKNHETDQSGRINYVCNVSLPSVFRIMYFYFYYRIYVLIL